MMRDKQLTAFINNREIEYYADRGEVNCHNVGLLVLGQAS